MRRTVVILGVLAVLNAGAGCTGAKRLDAVSALSDDSKALYAKYRQFLTENQQDHFLSLPSDEARREFIQGLKIEERVARYPPPIQDAIWAREVIPGMNAEAVLLSWGVPELRDFGEREDLQRWRYTRFDKATQVLFEQGLVI